MGLFFSGRDYMIRNTLFKIFFMLFIILFALPAISFSEGAKDKKYNATFFYDKAEKMEKLSIEEFYILLSQTGNKMVAFQKAFSQLRTEDGNFDYSKGKTWDMLHESHIKTYQRTSQLLALIKKDPNNISYSLALFLLMADMCDTATTYCEIPAFRSKLIDLNIDVLLWKNAFLKAHLFPLSIAKDKNEKLY